MNDVTARTEAPMPPSFLKTETYRANDLGIAGDAIKRLRDDDIGAIILKRAF